MDTLLLALVLVAFSASWLSKFKICYVVILPASEEVIKFWRNLPKASVDNKFLMLSGDSYFLGAKRRGNKLLIRESYEGLWNIVLDQQAQEVDKMTITGRIC